MQGTLSVSIWRGGRDARAGQFVAYDVPRLDNQTVLDVVTYVQRKLDASTIAWKATSVRASWTRH